ncbi:hypothetical protein [Pseudoxanthomonas mexicana]|uniref:hypothetical protein n=1 Tax=Pseudoxanthomonas mexicana TaxID=128785 RepID=UPI00398BBBF8
MTIYRATPDGRLRGLPSGDVRSIGAPGGIGPALSTQPIEIEVAFVATATLDETILVPLGAAPIVVTVEVAARSALKEYLVISAAPIVVEVGMSARVGRIGEPAMRARPFGILTAMYAQGLQLTELPPLQDHFQRWYAAEAAGWVAIDEHNRLLAKDAGDKATAAANAVVVTNTRVSVLEDGLQAESSRTTALTTRVVNVEGAQATQGSALSALQVTSTLQGDILTSHGQKLTSINVQITGLDGELINVANATSLLQAEVNSLGAAKATWGVYLTAGNLISGVQSINDGVLAEFNVLAHVFRLLSPGATNGMEVQDGYLRVWRGGTQVVIGNGFGTGGDLMLYAGPNVGVGSASKSNGTIWFDASGNAYFGGALHIGIQREAARSESTSPAASVSIGPFPSQGGAKTVLCSYTVAVGQGLPGNQVADFDGKPVSATVQVFRKIGTASETLFTTLNATGVSDASYEADAGPGGTTLVSITLSASSTSTDNSSSAGPYIYRAAISARNILGLSATEQVISLSSTES